MCKNLVLLARNPHQMIFTCEHGTIHLTHQQTTFCMTEVEFQHFVGVMAHMDLPDEPTEEKMELWIDSGGLRLTLPEVRSLKDLVQIALPRWEKLKLNPSLARPILSSTPDHSLN